MTRFIIFLAVAVTLCNLALAETSLRPYSPFDEPKPRIPKEIMEDKRLDVKVNVFVKSKNFRDLFAEITKQTGVKLTISHDLAAERAIIYFHARPLRDVMTEISGLFGYYWLPKGKPGEYRYELREDSRHTQRRKQVDKLRVDELNALFMRFTDKAMKDPAILDQLLQGMPDNLTWSRESIISSYKGVPDLLSCLGTDRIQEWVSANQSSSIPCKDLPATVQNGILEWVNKFLEYRRQLAIDAGRDLQQLMGFSIADLQELKLHILFPRSGDSLAMPHFYLRVRDENGGGKGWTSWPPSLATEDDLRKVMGEPQREMAILEKPLPDKCEIIVNKPRISEDDYGESYVTLGDVLEAIAKTAKVDVIADYYLQDSSLHLVRASHQIVNDAYCLSPFEKQELRKTLDLVKDKLRYAYKFDGSTLKLRYWPWFIRQPAPEPPPALIEKCWQELERKGTLSLETLIEIANLPDVQLEWRGFGFIPYASRAYINSDSLRMWPVLGQKMVSIAKTEAGLPVGSLNQEQFDKLADWAKEYKDDVQPSDLAQGVIHVRYTDRSEDDGGSFWRISVSLQGKAIDGDEICLAGKERLKQVIAQRKADAKADRVEVVEE